MTETYYLQKRQEYSTSSASPEIIAQAIKELDIKWKQQQKASVTPSETKGEID